MQKKKINIEKLNRHDTISIYHDIIQYVRGLTSFSFRRETGHRQIYPTIKYLNNLHNHIGYTGRPLFILE